MTDEIPLSDLLTAFPDLVLPPPVRTRDDLLRFLLDLTVGPTTAETVMVVGAPGAGPMLGSSVLHPGIGDLDVEGCRDLLAVAAGRLLSLREGFVGFGLLRGGGPARPTAPELRAVRLLREQALRLGIDVIGADLLLEGRRAFPLL
ncbi:hypothetical protein ACFFKU_01835 [Kineococcus gynurae]|uniref:Uncharacterized protein n=1 Tax=Kineococcus gynurae TaxID=452979 RepID=A0ABV5LSY0_9ACTN